jgi:DNA ligase-1
VVKALADITGIEAPALTHRIMGSWMPEDYTYDQLIQEQNAADNISRPYPFFLAYPIQETSEKRKSAEEVGLALGDANQWQAEWKWDGIRAQMIKRGGRRSLSGAVGKTWQPRNSPSYTPF